MSIYSELLKDTYKNMRLSFIEIFAGKTTEITELEEKTMLLHEILDNLKEMKTFVAQRCDDVSRCHYCDYTLLCERGSFL